MVVLKKWYCITLYIHFHQRYVWAVYYFIWKQMNVLLCWSSSVQNWWPKFWLEEILILAKSYMTISNDTGTGTDQKTYAFWLLSHETYNSNISCVNKIYETDPEQKDLTEDQMQLVLNFNCTHVFNLIQSLLQLWVWIWPSGVQKNDAEDLYWKSMLVMYKEHAHNDLPKTPASITQHVSFCCLIQVCAGIATKQWVMKEEEEVEIEGPKSWDHQCGTYCS